MKILMVHNYYNSALPSGEKTVFEAEKALLESHGHEVQLFTRNSDEILTKGIWGKLLGGMATPWNPWMVSAIRRKIRSFNPDVVHVHNTFPLISPAIFYAIGHKAARVLTLHNYRLFCSAGIPMRNGKVCTECIDQRSVLPALKYGCYRNSRAATFPVAVSIWLHRLIGTWTNQVEIFISLTEFQKERLVAAGLPMEKVMVKPNFFSANPVPLPWSKRDAYVVFVGRLSSEKGVETLVRAWELIGKSAPELRVIGDGPLRSKLESKATGLPIRFMGQLSSEQTLNQVGNAKLIVLPSECFEGFPLVLGEAFALGTPAAVSNIGPLPSIVDDGKNGVIFEPANAESLAHTIKKAWETSGLLERLGDEARNAFEKKYSKESNYSMLIQIYERAIAKSKSAGDRE